MSSSSYITPRSTIRLFVDFLPGQADNEQILIDQCISLSHHTRRTAKALICYTLMKFWTQWFRYERHHVCSTTVEQKEREAEQMILYDEEKSLFLRTDIPLFEKKSISAYGPYRCSKNDSSCNHLNGIKNSHMNIVLASALLNLTVSVLISALTYPVTQFHLIHTIAQYYGVAFIAYGVHRIAHDWRFPKFWHRAHVIGHHYTNYPPSKPESDKYIFKTETLWKEADTYMYTIPILFFLCCYARFVLHCTFFRFALHSALILVHFYIEVYVHEQVHLHNSWLNKFTMYKEIKRLHMIHHMHVHSNILFSNFLPDYLLGTFRN